MPRLTIRSFWIDAKQTKKKHLRDGRVDYTNQRQEFTPSGGGTHYFLNISCQKYANAHKLQAKNVYFTQTQKAINTHHGEFLTKIATSYTSHIRLVKNRTL